MDVLSPNRKDYKIQQ